MDIQRAKRYGDKLIFIKERQNNIMEWTSSGISDFVSDKRTILAVYKAFQELVEASLDIKEENTLRSDIDICIVAPACENRVNFL